MNQEKVLKEIEKEMSAAREARTKGIEGRARVCARRAAGIAGAWYLSSLGKNVREGNALDALHGLEAETSITSEVRDAAGRLASRISSDFRYAHQTDPLADSAIIIDFMKKTLA